MYDAPEELDLHGLKPEDAELMLEEFLAECVSRKLRFVKIIHGKGSGILRQRVRSCLALSAHVASFLDGPDLGSTGVHLKLRK